MLRKQIFLRKSKFVNLQTFAIILLLVCLSNVFTLSPKHASNKHVSSETSL